VSAARSEHRQAQGRNIGRTVQPQAAARTTGDWPQMMDCARSVTLLLSTRSPLQRGRVAAVDV
jgi:hypothetical protein